MRARGQTCLRSKLVYRFFLHAGSLAVLASPFRRLWLVVDLDGIVNRRIVCLWARRVAWLQWFTVVDGRRSTDNAPILRDAVWIDDAACERIQNFLVIEKLLNLGLELGLIKWGVSLDIGRRRQALLIGWSNSAVLDLLWGHPWVRLLALASQVTDMRLKILGAKDLLRGYRSLQILVRLSLKLPLFRRGLFLRIGTESCSRGTCGYRVKIYMPKKIKINKGVTVPTSQPA